MWCLKAFYQAGLFRYVHLSRWILELDDAGNFLGFHHIVIDFLPGKKKLEIDKLQDCSDFIETLSRPSYPSSLTLSSDAFYSLHLPSSYNSLLLGLHLTE